MEKESWKAKVIRVSLRTTPGPAVAFVVWAFAVEADLGSYRVLAAIAALMAASEIVTTAFRRFGTPAWGGLGLPRDEAARLRSYLKCELAGTIGLVALAILFILEPQLPGVFFLGYFSVALLHGYAQPGARGLVGSHTRTNYFKRKKLRGEELEIIVERSADNVGWVYAVLRKFFEARLGLSVYAMLLFTLMTAQASTHFVRTVEYLRSKNEHETKPPVKHEPVNPSQKEAPGAGTFTPPPGPTEPPSAADPEPLTWQRLCGKLPGYDAPEWARGTLYDLFLGLTGPGALVTGCTGDTQSLPSRADFVFLVGTDGTRTKSVAVDDADATSYPPTLFLSPAARPALDLINSVGPLGGSPRFDVGNGDMYVIWSGAGTWLLMRSQKNSARDSRYAQPYVLVPPAVADEWFAELLLRNEWIWVTHDADDPATGYETFHFWAGRSGKLLRTIRVNPSTGEALIEMPQEIVSHLSEARRLDMAAIRRIASDCLPQGAPRLAAATC